MAVATACNKSTPTTPSPPPASTAVTLNDDFSGRRLFPADNWWNQEIASAPIDPQSAAFIDFVGRTRTLHPDFGPPPYGISLPRRRRRGAAHGGDVRGLR